jgi:ABC-type ATPase with predicted acetyltransferase domain
MPSFNIIKSIKSEESFRNDSIKGQFDLNIDVITEKYSGVIDIENREWNVGLIVGSSGSGKTTIAKQLFGKYIIENNYGVKSVLDEMPSDKTTEQITSMFNSVGFATVWSWLKPYSVLSNGERMRVDLAKALLSSNDIICFDEFTSVIDRTIAKTASFAIQKCVKKVNKKFIAVSCHRDIIDWLEPDWIYDTDERRFFFVLVNTDVQNSESKYGKLHQKSGCYLKSIII